MNMMVFKRAGLLISMGALVSFAHAEGETNAVPQEAPVRPSREEVIKRFDTDVDGVLSEAERTTMRETLRKERGQSGRRPITPEMIKQFDADGDGVLSETERATMQEAMKKRRAEGAPERQRPDRKAMLERFDADGDGVLSESERQTMRETLKAERQAAVPSKVETE
ncbi:MAG: EF-hand domain-containing protein [Pontiellaceae bacterium]|nr:EF-hand domain-containing protein [Pontiellaceae bacterium]MBN2785539.1 EF-hand domain-containing protein [Pontiellaceae bacterium]